MVRKEETNLGVRGKVRHSQHIWASEPGGALSCYNVALCYI